MTNRITTVKADKAQKTEEKEKTGIHEFQLPVEIPAHVPGLLPEAVRSINVLLNAHIFGRELFDSAAPQYEDWIMLFIILANEAEGKSTVTKNFVEVTGRAYGTVRATMRRFEARGYIRTLQRIGRAELYVPTDKLKKAVNQWGRNLWPYINKLEEENETTRGTSRMS